MAPIIITNDMIYAETFGNHVLTLTIVMCSFMEIAIEYSPELKLWIMFNPNGDFIHLSDVTNISSETILAPTGILKVNTSSLRINYHSLSQNDTCYIRSLIPALKPRLETFLLESKMLLDNAQISSCDDNGNAWIKFKTQTELCFKTNIHDYFFQQLSKKILLKILSYLTGKALISGLYQQYFRSSKEEIFRDEYSMVYKPKNEEPYIIHRFWPKFRGYYTNGIDAITNAMSKPKLKKFVLDLSNNILGPESISQYKADIKKSVRVTKNTSISNVVKIKMLNIEAATSDYSLWEEIINFVSTTSTHTLRRIWQDYGQVILQNQISLKYQNITDTIRTIPKLTLDFEYKIQLPNEMIVFV